MSFHKTYIEAFIHLIEKQFDDLFFQDWVALEQFGSSLPKGIEELANAIVSWCQARPPIYEALSDIYDTLRNSEQKSERFFGSGVPPLPEKDHQTLLKETIKNRIARSCQPGSSPSSQQKT